MANFSRLRDSTPSLATSLRPPSAASSAIPTPLSSHFAAVEKNMLRSVRHQPSLLLRSNPPTGTRPRLRWPARLPRIPRSPRQLSAVPGREARTPRLACRQPALHPVLRHPRRPLLPGGHRQGRCRGPASSTGTPSRNSTSSICKSSSTGPAVPAPEVIGIDELSIGPRHTYRIVVSDLLRRRAHLVRWLRPLRSQHGCLLYLARAREIPANPPGGHGHVEALSRLHAQNWPRSAGPDRLRQVPCPEALARPWTRSARTNMPA